MKLKKLTIFITLIFFLSFLSCEYTNENFEQKSQEKIKKETRDKPRDLEGKIRDLFTPDEVSPIRGFVRKVQELLKEFGQENFDIESIKKDMESNKEKQEKEKHRTPN